MLIIAYTMLKTGRSYLDLGGNYLGGSTAITSSDISCIEHRKDYRNPLLGGLHHRYDGAAA
jgi:hypothetical protein